MSMVCFGLAEQLHAKEQEIRSIPVTDADSLCAYLKAYWEFIYNHKMFGSTTSMPMMWRSTGRTALYSGIFRRWNTRLCAFVPRSLT